MDKYSKYKWFPICYRKSEHKVCMVRPYGTYFPYIKNSTPRNLFEFLCHFVYSGENIDHNEKFNSKSNTILKVGYVLEVLMKGTRNTFFAKNKIYKNMVDYTGRGISLIQYMPLKPIKHGMKDFYFC